MKRLLSCFAVTLVLTGGLALAQARASFERTLDVSGAVQLDVSSRSGSITVRTGGDGVVEIHGEVRARSSLEDDVREIAANPPIRQDGNIIRIGPIDNGGSERRVSVSYELVVPAATELETSTGSGSQEIADIAGPLDATTGSGSLEIGRIGASVEARTGSGSITIEGVDGDLEVTTGSGSIRAEAVNGSISATSGSGPVRLQQTGSGDVSVQTGSGRVRIEGARGGLRVHSGSGRVDVDGEMTGEWDLRTSSGSIEGDAAGYVGLRARRSYDLG